MSRDAKVEIVALLLYCAILLRMDKQKGLLTAAGVFQWYGSKMRDVGNWAYTCALRAENAARELVEP